MNEECLLSEQEGDELYEKNIQESYSKKSDEQRLIVDELQNNRFEYEKRVEINTEDYLLLCNRYRLYIQYDDEYLIDRSIQLTSTCIPPSSNILKMNITVSY